MKLAAITVAAIIAATSSSAAEIGSVPGLSLGGEIVAESNVTAGTNSIVLTPEASYEIIGFVASVSTDIEIYSTDLGSILDREFDSITDDVTLDLYLGKEIVTNTVAYVETSYNVGAQEMGDVVVGVSFTF